MTGGPCLPCYVMVVLWYLPLGMLTSVAALSVSLTKVLPQGNPVAGDTVILRCNVSNLQAGHIIEWVRRINDADTTVVDNGTSLASGYTVHPSSTMPRYETLIITADKQDTGLYYCRVLCVTDGSRMVLLSAVLYLSVHYFPADIYPTCNPQGPFSAQHGSTYHISCTSEKGNPTAQMDFISTGDIYPLEYSNTTDTQTVSLDLSVTTGVNTLAFECKVTSPSAFPNMQRSCTIGPIQVRFMTNEQSTVQSPIFQPKSTFLFTLKTTSPTSHETSSSATNTVTVVKSSMRQSEAQTSEMEPMTTTRPRGSSLQAVTDTTSSSVGGGISVAIIAGVASGAGFLLLLMLTSIIIICTCFCGLRGDKKEKHLLPTDSTRPNVISGPSSEPAVSHHSSSSLNKHVYDKGTMTAAEASGEVVCPISVQAQPLSTPNHSLADRPLRESVHDGTQTLPSTWKRSGDSSDMQPSDMSSLNISAHAEHTQHSTSYSMLARGMKQEPLYADVSQTLGKSVGKGAERVPSMETGANSSITPTNPTYASNNHKHYLLSPRKLGSVKTKLESPPVKQVSWKT